jgi:hypothetical protein
LPCGQQQDASSENPRGQPGTGDASVFDISVYSSDDTQMTRPLIEFSQLTVPLS